MNPFQKSGSKTEIQGGKIVLIYPRESAKIMPNDDNKMRVLGYEHSWVFLKFLRTQELFSAAHESSVFRLSLYSGVSATN